METYSKERRSICQDLNKTSDSDQICVSVRYHCHHVWNSAVYSTSIAETYVVRFKEWGFMDVSV